jgi:hypothetical protein
MVSRTAASFRVVSEVMIARAATVPPFGFTFAAIDRIPRKTFRIGNCTPILPVEHTKTWCGRHSSAFAVSTVIRFASAIPLTPVHALALPLLRTTARIGPFLMWACVTRTGPAFT